MISHVASFQKIGYDNAAAVAKKAHKEGSTLKVMALLAFLHHTGMSSGSLIFPHYLH